MVFKCTQNRIFKIFIMVYKGWLWLLPNALTSPLIPPSHPLPSAHWDGGERMSDPQSRSEVDTVMV